jgi:hypothetical protein
MNNEKTVGRVASQASGIPPGACSMGCSDYLKIGQGLWRDPHAMAPWKFKRSRKKIDG